MLLSIGGITIDYSLDARNSPPIIHKGVTCMHTVLFGFLGEGYTLNYYGYTVDSSGTKVFYLTNSTFGSTTCTPSIINIHSYIAGYGWVGNKLWLVGGDTNAGKINL